MIHTPKTREVGMQARKKSVWIETVTTSMVWVFLQGHEEVQLYSK
jgi:hypothetical protein